MKPPITKPPAPLRRRASSRQIKFPITNLRVTTWLVIVSSLTLANGCNKADSKASEHEADVKAAKAEMQKLQGEVEARDKELAALKAKLAQVDAVAAKGQQPKPTPDAPTDTNQSAGGIATFRDGKTRKFTTLSGARLSEPGPGQVSFTRAPGELVFYAPGGGPNEVIIPVESIKEISFPEKGGKLAVTSTDGRSHTREVGLVQAIYVHWEPSLIEQILDTRGIKFTFGPPK
jgi:hypothetical protein